MNKSVLSYSIAEISLALGGGGRILLAAPVENKSPKCQVSVPWTKHRICPTYGSPLQHDPVPSCNQPSSRYTSSASRSTPMRRSTDQGYQYRRIPSSAESDAGSTKTSAPSPPGGVPQDYGTLRTSTSAWASSGVTTSSAGHKNNDTLAGRRHRWRSGPAGAVALALLVATAAVAARISALRPKRQNREEKGGGGGGLRSWASRTSDLAEVQSVWLGLLHIQTMSGGLA